MGQVKRALKELGLQEVLVPATTLRLLLSWGHSQEAVHLCQHLGDPWEGPAPIEQEGLRRLHTMALLSGTSLLPSHISQLLSQPDDMMESSLDPPGGKPR